MSGFWHFTTYLNLSENVKKINFRAGTYLPMNTYTRLKIIRTLDLKAVFQIRIWVVPYSIRRLDPDPDPTSEIELKKSTGYANL